MSNAVDILIVNGPLAGDKVCQPRPVPESITVQDHVYYPVAYSDLYWVAVADKDADNEAVIEAALASTGWEPSWDLLRAAGQHP